MTTTTTLRRRILAGGLLVSLALLALPGASMAKDGDIVRTGDCSGSTNWKVKLGQRDGGIEAEGEIDQNRNGVRWTWTFKNDGVRFANGSSVTQAPSGSFSVERRTANGPGPDTIVFRAVNPATGEVCRGVANI